MLPEDLIRVRDLRVRCTEEIQNRLAELGLYLHRSDIDQSAGSLINKSPEREDAGIQSPR